MQLIELLREQLENLKSPSDIRKYLCFILKIELYRFDVLLSIVLYQESYVNYMVGRKTVICVMQ
jgi:hypothetical protein